MTDLERRIRSALDEEARSAPPPHEAAPAVRRTHRRQATTAAGTLLGIVVLATASILGIRAVLTGEGGTPAGTSLVTTSMNGVSITYPDSWHLIDPDQAGLNGPPDGTRTLPRIVLALSPLEAGDRLACPGLIDGTPPTFLMTVQEEPLALTGEAATPWPVALGPMDVGTSGAGGCYPSWAFLRAGWTAGGRTFEARVGLASDVSDEDRVALEAAFESMTFQPAVEPAATVVIATGSAGGEDWQLIANGENDGLSLTLQSRTFGTGTGGYDPASPQLRLTDHVFGTGAEAERVVFGAVPADAVRVGARLASGDEMPVDVIDVPDTIGPRMNAFVLQLDPSRAATIVAYAADGEVLALGRFCANGACA